MVKNYFHTYAQRIVNITLPPVTIIRPKIVLKMLTVILFMHFMQTDLNFWISLGELLEKIKLLSLLITREGQFI